MQLFADSVKRVGVNAAGYRVGETHHRAKLTDEAVDQMRELHTRWKLSYAEIAAKFDDVPGGVSPHTVRDICRGRKRIQVALKFVWRP